MSVFGFSTEPSSGGDFTPIVKYDARAGRLFRVDSIDTGSGFEKNEVDITSTFKAIVDFENIEVGWMHFTPGGTPSFSLVPMGAALPAKPSPNHKNGVRFMLKLAKDCGGDKPIRELSQSSKAFLSGVETVYHSYLADKGNNPGKLPVIVPEKITPIKSGSGTKTSTNYQPTFKIAGWAPRGDLAFQPKGTSEPAAEQVQTAPHTGSTVVEAPRKEAAMADDFG
jgi:hypothetical protein